MLRQRPWWIRSGKNWGWEIEILKNEPWANFELTINPLRCSREAAEESSRKAAEESSRESGERIKPMAQAMG
jgi:hypothetical protein